MLVSGSSYLAPGVSFGSYVVRELIGRGGMGCVYRAEHLLLNKPVALKVMDRALLVNAGARQRFLLEGRAAAAIKHPNVVDIADVGLHDGLPFLVMELLSGEDLEVHLGKRLRLEEAAVVRLALPLISALHAAHSRGVVHRDIKPSNIFLSIGPDEQIVPKVLDFGISKVSFESSKLDLVATPQHQIIGTPRYLPPEALQGAGELGPAADQYSLGVVLYQCVTGRTPFSGDTLISLLNSLSAGTFQPPRAIAPEISPGLDRVIMRALSADPARRYPTIRDMGRALLELAAERTQMVWGHSFRAAAPVEEDQTAPSVTPPTTEPIEHGSARPRRGRRAVAALGALAAAGLLLVLAAKVLGVSRPVAVPLPVAPAEAATQVTTTAVAPPQGVTPAVLGLMPRPLEPRPEDEASERGAAREKAGSRRPSAAAPRRRPPRSERAPAEAPGAATSKDDAAAARAGAAAAKAGAAAGEPEELEAASERGGAPAPRAAAEPGEAKASAPAVVAPRSPPAPPTAPRKGANGSPLLD